MKSGLKEILHTEDLFDSLAREERIDFKNFKVKRTPALEEICQKYKEWETWYLKSNIEHEQYKFYSETVKKIGKSYSPKDILAFSMVLPKYYDGKYGAYTGLFLSALVNTSKSKKVVLFTEYLKDLEWLGYNNQKHLIIQGDAGIGLGEYMENGVIEVNGSAGDLLGASMRGGKIIVKGDVKGKSGVQMENGNLILHSDRVENIGEEMQGGKIEVYGNVEECGSDMKNGSIYVHGNADSIDPTGKGTIIVDGNVSCIDGGRGNIIVKGDVEEIRDCDTGGKIHIHGLVEKIGRGSEVGEGGGEIYLHKRCNPIINQRFGRIYYRNKLIWEDGRIML